MHSRSLAVEPGALLKLACEPRNRHGPRAGPRTVTVDFSPFCAAAWTFAVYAVSLLYSAKTLDGERRDRRRSLAFGDQLRNDEANDRTKLKAMAGKSKGMNKLRRGR